MTKEIEICEVCCQVFPKDELIFGPDPFNWEINDDDTPVWLCKKCRQDSADDI